MVTGMKVQVWHGTTDRTPGGLTHADLVKNKHGKVVLKAKHDSAKALHPNGPPALAETRQGGLIQLLAPYSQHLATAASHLDAAMRSGRIAPETVRCAAAAVMAHRGRGRSGLLSMLGIKTPLADIPIIRSILR